MTAIRYIVIIVFSLLSVCIGLHSYGQTKPKQHCYLITYIGKSSGQISHWGDFYVNQEKPLSRDSLEKWAIYFMTKNEDKLSMGENYQVSVTIMGIYEFKTQREWEYYQRGN
jgi:hypothetical protein